MDICAHCGKRVPSTAQRAKIRALADGLRTINQIAEATGTTYSNVYMQVRKEELDVRREGRQERKWARYMLAAKQRAEGKTLAEIGAGMGIGKERVRQMVSEVDRINGKITGS